MGQSAFLGYNWRLTKTPTQLLMRLGGEEKIPQAPSSSQKPPETLLVIGDEAFFPELGCSRASREKKRKKNLPRITKQRLWHLAYLYWFFSLREISITH